jgi:hypothetical protein
VKTTSALLPFTDAKNRWQVIQEIGTANRSSKTISLHVRKIRKTKNTNHPGEDK